MDEHAVVLKHLELRAVREEGAVEELTVRAATLLDAASEQRAAGARTLSVLRLTAESNVRDYCAGLSSTQPHLALSRTNWAELRNDAVAALKAEGIAPSSVTLPPSEHRLDKIDIAAGVAFGALGALMPSLGSRRGFIGDKFLEIQRAADGERLPKVIQSIFGRHPAPFMDAGASGIYHRFCDGHDLLVALPAGVKKLGWARGPLEVFQHLLTDSFGATGIPLPGSDFIGSAVAQLAGVSSLTDLISARDLSRYTSLRMSDGAATGVTSLLLWLYGKTRGLPDGSMRRSKLGVLAHGLCLLGVAATAALPGLAHLVPFRSHLNYVSLVALAKNALAWRAATQRLRDENESDFARICAGTRELEALRGMVALPDAVRGELRLAAHMIANA
jgi:hypothetical protein